MMYQKLRDIRKNHGYKAKHMADKLGISKSFYLQLETRYRRLSYDMAVKIAKIFNMQPDEIFYEDHLRDEKEKTSKN